MPNTKNSITDWLLKSISFIFHPIIMPILGTVFYFSKSPRFLPAEIRNAKLISLSILTILLPILIYFLLKTLGKTYSIYLKSTKERIIPLFINSIILILIILRVVPSTQIIELYFFFIGILISTIVCLILAILKFKASIHMIAISGVFMFAVGLSLHFGKNLNGSLALFAIIAGAIATSRLHLKAHTPIELIFGFFIGFLPQLIIFQYWL
ncbi:membrane protein [Lacinutrix sp. 5H-3-7-4]|uniref:membrane protein n=1 Tax=Lacinutrix sp. (strain 5H-3-7-4) TaxID=983544 RepID=UPI00020A3C9D|nr:membrane protein [Lacinutrix sp. 5H-3-7-4]AEH00553.1 putative transmembrane protein [Lacinutrix sp. 5H-3-7-4]